MLANGPFLVFDFRKSKIKNGPLASLVSNLLISLGVLGK